MPDGNFYSLGAVIKRLFYGRDGFKTFWNSDARFVVACATKFSMSQQKKIFYFLSQLRIYNCIIVSLEHDVIGRENSRLETFHDVDTGMIFGVYSWFPYQSSNRCDIVHDITLLDSWVIYGQGHFTKNTDLFPRKIGNSFNGCPMKAFVMPDLTDLVMPFKREMSSNGKGATDMEVAYYMLLRTVLHHMNMSLLVTTGPEIATRMFTKELHIIVGPFIQTDKLFRIFDTTSVYHMHTYSWYVPCYAKYPRWSSIYNILSVKLWVILIISIVTVAISTALVGRYSRTSEWQRYKTVANTLTDVWAVILGVGVPTMPRTPSVRSLFLAWVCFSIAFNTVFQAFLTTFLIDSGYKPPIESMDQLFSSGMKLVYPAGMTADLEYGNGTEVSNIRRNKANCPSQHICFNWALFQHNVSFFASDFIVEAMADFSPLFNKNGRHLFCRIDDGVFLNHKSVMLMFYGEPLLKRVNEIIDRVVEAGLYKYWVSHDKDQFKVAFRKLDRVNQTEEYYSFNLYHMQPAFHFLLMGLCLSAFCFVIELFCYRLLNKRK
jgi:hypothetical protein